jgi:tetratricopeptide (TPR) repeat protein
MAMVYDVQQDLEKAALYYRKTLDLDPKNQSATIGLQLSQARVMLGNDPENPELRLRLAKILFSLKRFKEVIALFPFKQTSTVPTNIAAMLATSYQSLGDFGNALYYYKHLLKNHPNDARLQEIVDTLSGGK